MKLEKELIETYLLPLAQNDPAALGFQDDAALFQPEPGQELVISKDLSLEGVHFLSSDTPENIGFKALAVNISDMNAKAAQPRGFFLGLAFPDAPDPSWMEGFCKSLGILGQAFDCPLLGGDITYSKGGLAISVTIFGTVEAGKMVKRSTANEGDRIFVSGTLGDAALGLKLMQDSDLQQHWQLDDEETRYLKHRYRHPIPRGGFNPLIKEFASAAIDVSDGLVSDLENLCRASNKSADVQINNVPLSSALQKAIKVEPALFSHALGWGDDYEIMATIPEHRVKDFKQECMFNGVPVTEIGTITAGAHPPHYFNENGEKQQLLTSTFEHF